MDHRYVLSDRTKFGQNMVLFTYFTYLQLLALDKVVLDFL